MVPRGVVITEAVFALELANILIEQLGGDSLEKIKKRYKLNQQI
jgi:chorismate synthase